MKKIYFYSLVLILFILQGCSFEPKGEEFVTVDPTGKLPNIEVNLNLATDTIYIQKDATLTFVYALNGEQVNWAQFIINGKGADLIKNIFGSIQLSWHFDYNSGGTYPLEMKIFTKSQTGSIGDKLGAEGYLISRKWIMVVMDQNQMAPTINKLELVDGSLKIEWNKFKGVDFKSYKIYKETAYTNYNRQLIATIKSRDQTSFIDTTYYGKRTDYYIITNSEFWSPINSIINPHLELMATNTITGDILLKWNKPPFYKNLKGYRIYYCINNGINQQVADLNNTDESFIIPHPLFACNYELFLSLLPLADNFDESTLISELSSTARAYYGITTPDFKMAIGGLAPISYLLNDKDGIRVFDHQKSTTTRQIKYNEIIYNFDVSVNNKYMVSVINSPRKIYFEDLIEPANSKKIDIGAYPQMGLHASISNVGTGVIFNGQTAVLYDYIKESKLAEIQLMYNNDYGNKISPSGNFFHVHTFSGNEYFQYKDNQIIRLNEFSSSGGAVMDADYLPGNNEKLIRTYANRVEVVDCNTWTLEKKWLLPNEITEVYNLDMKSGKLLFRESNKLILLDVMNGTREELITVGDLSYLQGKFFYNDGQVLWGYGKGLK